MHGQNFFVHDRENLVIFLHWYIVSAGEVAEGGEYAMRIGKIKTGKTQGLLSSSADRKSGVDMTGKNIFFGIGV